MRLPGHDYALAGAYFVTLCVQNSECLFGRIEDDEMVLNEMGTIAAEAWEWLAGRYDHVDMDTYVVMPNHLHGIIVLSEPGRGGSRTPPTITHPNNQPHGKNATKPIKRNPLGRLIGAFKTVSTKRINRLRQKPGARIWQRNYYEHVIRNPQSLQRIREYIQTNPLRWALDRENPVTVSAPPTTEPGKAEPWRV